MVNRKNIQYLRQREIDKVRWDNCIGASKNGLIYGYSHYLDTMSDNWDALVYGDYEMVMPLPWRKKWGIYYLYQPPLCAQLGLFGNKVDEEVLKSFLEAIPSKFKLWEFSLNHQNVFSVPGFNIYERANYVLHLGTDYETLNKNYRENVKRNIKKARQFNCYNKKDFAPSHVIELATSQTRIKKEKEAFQNFEKVYSHYRKKDQAITYGVWSPNDELLASCIFLFSHGRAYYILVGNHPNGRTIGSSHLLIDNFIQDYASNDLMLDFEGSDIRNLAFFYSSFGAKEEKYAAVAYKKLPWYARIAK